MPTRSTSAAKTAAKKPAAGASKSATSARKTATGAARSTTNAAKSTAKSAAKTAGKTVSNTGAAVQAAQKKVLENHKQATETVNQTMESAVNMTREQTEKATADVLKGVEEMSQTQQQAFDALTKSGTAFTKGIEEMGRVWMGYMQSAFDANLQAGNKMLAARTVREFAEIQQETARKNFDDMVSEATKLSEIGFKTANDAIEPISVQVNESITRAARA